MYETETPTRDSDFFLLYIHIFRKRIPNYPIRRKGQSYEDFLIMYDKQFNSNPKLNNKIKEEYRNIDWVTIDIKRLIKQPIVGIDEDKSFSLYKKHIINIRFQRNKWYLNYFGDARFQIIPPTYPQLIKEKIEHGI